MKLVIKIGGSLAIGSNGPNYKYVSKLIPLLKEIGTKHKIIIVIGGGILVKKYLNSLKRFGLSNTEMEWIAIDILRANVRFFSFMLDKKPIFSLKELNENSECVLGGIVPGRSTDANAAYAAKIIKADLLIKMTNVDGIYTKDPKLYQNVKKINRLTFNELKKYIKNGSPGSYGILDKLAIEIITKNKIKSIIINGNPPENLIKVLRGERIGTWIF